MPKNFTPAMDCTAQPTPDITLTPVKSSQIKAIGYQPETKTLAVTFTRGPGNVYTYDNVEPETHQAFTSAPSLGEFFGKHIAALPSKKYAPDLATVA